jgi:hypothetical protein
MQEEPADDESREDAKNNYRGTKERLEKSRHREAIL